MTTSSEGCEGGRTTNGIGAETSEPWFRQGDKVMVSREKDQSFQAEVVKATKADGGFKYFLHYIGWNKRYDEWLPEASLKRFDEATYAALSKKENAAGSRSKKRRRSEGEGAPYADMVKVAIPRPMKSYLVREWDSITRSGRTLPLPRRHTAAQVLDDFLQDVGRKEPYPEVVISLKTYFDRTLNPLLLYPQELEQAQTHALDAAAAPSDVYGAEHLLRLLVKLPEILPYSEMDEDSLARLASRLSGVMMFMSKNFAKYFPSDYAAAGDGGGDELEAIEAEGELPMGSNDAAA